MIASLCALVLAMTPQQSLLQQVVPNPTGQNGYEDYLRAADAVGDRAIADVYANWSPTQYEKMAAPRPPNSDGPNVSAEQLSLAKRLSTMTLLDVRRETATRYGKVLGWLRQGSAKKAWQPRTSVDHQSTFPEFGYFGRVAKIGAAAAYVAYADGRNQEGTKILLDTLQMAQGIDGTITLAGLYAVLIDSTAITELYRHFPAMGMTEAIAVEKAAAKILAEPIKMIDILAGEAKVRIKTLSAALENPDAFLKDDGSDPETTKWLKSVKALSADARLRVIAAAENVTKQRLDPILAKLRGPESSWPGSDKALGTIDYQNLQGDVDGILAYWLRMTSPSYAQVGIRLAVIRTRLRLLGLYASVVRYKWEKGRLPGTLEDAVDASRVTDPLTGDKFAFEPQGVWDFRIYSQGTEGTGPIDLNYQDPYLPPDRGQTPP